MARLQVKIPDFGQGEKVALINGEAIDGIRAVDISVSGEDLTTVTIEVLGTYVDIEQIHELEKSVPEVASEDSDDLEVGYARQAPI